jgi:hypothetical protein
MSPDASPVSPYYVSFDDYSATIPLQKLRDLVLQDESARVQVEQQVQSQFREKLGVRFDVEQTLERRGPKRDPSLVRHMIAAVLYHLYSRVVNRNVPPIVERRYKEAMAWCDDAVQGKISVELPLKIEAETQQPQRPSHISVISTAPKLKLDDY